MIYEIYDLKAKNSVAVFLRSRDEDAIRSFEHLLSDPSETVFTIAPEDFNLRCIDPYGDKLEQRVRLVKSGSEYSKLALHQFRIERIKAEDDLFAAIGKAYIKLQEEKKNDGK